MSLEYDAYEHTITYRVGKRVTTWELDNEDILDTLEDILFVVKGQARTVEAKPASYIEPPVPAYDVDKMKKALGLPETPKPEGVSWDDEAGVDTLPIF